MKPSLKADLLILLSAILWGGEYVVVKDMVEYLPPNWINAFRFITASLILLPLFPRRILKIDRAQLKAGVILGFFLFAGFTFQTIGIQYTSASKSGFITSTYVVIVPFVVWLLRRKFPGIKALIAALVCITGIALISFEGEGMLGMNPGDLLTLLAALAFTGSIISIDHYAKIHDPVNLTFIEMLSGGLMSLVLALIFEPFPVVRFGGSEIFQIVYIVVLGSLLCHGASNVAMKWAKPSHASILWSTESVFALAFAIVFLREIPTLKTIVGFVLIFAAVLVSEISVKEQ